MASSHTKTATVGAGSDESIDTAVWEAFEEVRKASRPQPDDDPTIKTMRELQVHFGQSRSVVRKWLAAAIKAGRVERVMTYRANPNGSIRPVPGYRVLNKVLKGDK